MKSFDPRTFLRSRFPVAILSGLLLAVSFPNIGIAGLAWIAPGLMLAATLGCSRRDSFRLGYVAGFFHYLASLYWLLLIPVTGFPIFGWITLSAFLALYPATWVWIANRIAAPARPTHGREKSGSTWLDAAGEMARWSWGRRALWAFSCAATWVALEIVVARFLGGFPWNLLGSSQFRILPLIQIASFTSLYGVSFLLVWTSAAILCGVVAIVGRPGLRHVWLREIVLPIIAVTAAFTFGFRELSHSPLPARHVTATLIQPSIPQTLIWDADGDAVRFRELLRLSEEALAANDTDILIWPEAAIPSLLRYDKEVMEGVTGLARRHGVWMIVGADDVEMPPHSNRPEDRMVFNSSFLIAPDGSLVKRYQKRNLVIFGEYVPLERSLPFMKWLTPISGGFTPGTEPVPFEIPELDITTSVLICFEDIFPHLAREYATADTDFLVNLTNNGWFGEGAAQWQHAAGAVFRAIENRLPLIRCTNNGLTCWIDTHGRLREIFRDDRGRIYGAGYLTVQIPLPDPNQQRTSTFYNRHGDWFGWGCVAFAACTILATAMRRRKTER